jgi:hypothetical protein
MNDQPSRERPFQTGTVTPAAEDKPPWQSPDLAYLGKLGDLVQGHGKQGSVFDADPNVTQKSGVG